MRFCGKDPPDRFRVSPDMARLKSPNPLRDETPVPKACWDSVRGRKCLQRHDFMFKRIRLRSTVTVDDKDDEEEEEGSGREEPVGSEVLVSEVLELRSGELGSGEESESSCGSESKY